MHGDCSETVFVGEVDDAAKKLVRVTWECLLKAIDVVRPGQLLNAIGLVIEAHARDNGFSIVREFTGHGIGESFHMAPYIAHFYEPDNTAMIEEGMTFTIEPMINDRHRRMHHLAGQVDGGDRRSGAQRPVRAHSAGDPERGGDPHRGRQPWFLKQMRTERSSSAQSCIAALSCSMAYLQSRVDLCRAALPGQRSASSRLLRGRRVELMISWVSLLSGLT